jgi:serine/threonine protein kinase
LWARFLREAQVTGQLEHPGIVPVYEVGKRRDDQSPFHTMRFVRGRTLAEAARAYHERRGRGEAGRRFRQGGGELLGATSEDPTIGLRPPSRQNRIMVASLACLRVPVVLPG